MLKYNYMKQKAYYFFVLNLFIWSFLPAHILRKGISLFYISMCSFISPQDAMLWVMGFLSKLFPPLLPLNMWTIYCIFSISECEGVSKPPKWKRTKKSWLLTVPRTASPYFTSKLPEALTSTDFSPVLKHCFLKFCELWVVLTRLQLWEIGHEIRVEPTFRFKSMPHCHMHLNLGQVKKSLTVKM